MKSRLARTGIAAAALLLLVTLSPLVPRYARDVRDETE